MPKSWSKIIKIAIKRQRIICQIESQKIGKNLLE